MNRITEVVKHLIIINAILFIGVSLLKSSGIDLTRYLVLHYPLSDRFLPHQLVTNIFMHADISHIFFNMLALFFLGPFVEQRMGAKRFLMFYIACGLAGMLAHLGVSYINLKDAPEIIGSLTQQQLDYLLVEKKYNTSYLSHSQAGIVMDALRGTLQGASGAILGVTMAFAAFFPNMKLMLLFPPIPIKAKYMALIIIAIDLFSGVSRQSTGIAHFAHLGGAIMGFILVYMWYGNIFKDMFKQ